MAGTSSYPESVDNKTQLQDGVDYMEADNVNNAYVPINKTQTFIGASGKAASWSTDVLEFLANADTPRLVPDSSTQFTVTAGTVVVKNSGQSVRLLGRSTSSKTVTASNIDTGSMAVGFYYVYAVKDSASTDFTVVFSTSETTPTGVTQYELIGWFYNESAGVMDLTNSMMGTLNRNGRYVDNRLDVQDATGASHTGDTNWTDVLSFDIKFYAPSKKIRVVVNSAMFTSANGESGAIGIEIDSSDKAETERWMQATGTTGLTGLELVGATEWVGTVAAAQVTVQVRMKVINSGHTVNVINNFIHIEEVQQ